ncbi:MAG: sigma-54-dependent Fis family transcriptional regulator [Alphaproteobacteria bacterium]|nr:sigma-54-dependent Fis family transcriptional regulator [Alphaproteobacteria bacterium]
MCRLKRRLPRVAKAQRTTLIVGETGTGKELVARSLHQLSARRELPFVTVNCGALPDNLVESELFGHVRGAFTGAEQSRHGLVRTASRGTLFLDEVNSLSLRTQARLLRFLETGEYRPVGSDAVERSEAWIVAATNVDLQAPNRSGGFREDLLHRLQVVRVEVPPLQVRGEDILFLAEHFRDQAGGAGLAFTEGARHAMMAHAWTGNVRELRNRVESAVLLAEGDAIGVEDLGLASVPGLAATSGADDARIEDTLWALVEENGLTLSEAVTLCERILIREALKAEDHNRTRAASRLGIHVRTIFKKLARTDEVTLH